MRPPVAWARVVGAPKGPSRSPGWDDAHRREGGFSLCEVVVAIVCLGVGLLGVTGIILHALERLSDADLRSGAVAAAEAVADSLVASGVAGGGGRRIVGGRVDWTPRGSGNDPLRRVTLTAHRSDGSLLFVVALLAPGAGDGDP